ncbi:MAG: peptide deformylase [Dehalococcoidales bacterium]|nr:MAG: peptide deformylase [Dehalococcoidales bacterium]
MAVLAIRTLPDPVLRQKAKRVKSIDKSIYKLINDMVETMHSASGVGLAAPQVGVPLRVIVIGMPEEEELALINPQIVRRTGERLVNEGCLSIPGYFAPVQRAEVVRVKGLDRTGKEIRLRADELLAQALEHEIDHINGVLYVDHLESMDELQPVEPASNEPMA